MIRIKLLIYALALMVCANIAYADRDSLGASLLADARLARLKTVASDTTVQSHYNYGGDANTQTGWLGSLADGGESNGLEYGR